MTTTALESEPEFLTPPEVAGMLRVSVKTLANWRHAASGPPFVRQGRRILYRRAAVERWVALSMTGGEKLRRA